MIRARSTAQYGKVTVIDEDLKATVRNSKTYLREALGRLQNSRRAWNAIIRGELSPPNPTPSSPVGGEVG